MARPVKFTDRDKSWCRKRNPQRSYRTRPLRERLLIVCEGKKTEPNYFESLKAMLPPQVAEVIDIQGLGANTQSLVNAARGLRDKRRDTDYPYDEVWVVFDRDSFDPDMFDNAIHSAKQAGMKVAWSNEAFEIWYLLHFEDRQTGMCREAYQDRLSYHLKERYKKNESDMYSKLQKAGNEEHAHRRARQRQTEHAGIPPHQANPCTTVNDLVKRLNKFKT